MEITYEHQKEITFDDAVCLSVKPQVRMLNAAEAKGQVLFENIQSLCPLWELELE